MYLSVYIFLSISIHVKIIDTFSTSQQRYAIKNTCLCKKSIEGFFIIVIFSATYFIVSMPDIDILVRVSEKKTLLKWVHSCVKLSWWWHDVIFYSTDVIKFAYVDIYGLWVIFCVINEPLVILKYHQVYKALQNKWQNHCNTAHIHNYSHSIRIQISLFQHEGPEPFITYRDNVNLFLIYGLDK